MLLTKRLLSDSHFPDVGVVHRCLVGFQLVGQLDRTGVFEERPPEEVIRGADEVWLARCAKIRGRELIRRVEQDNVDEVSEAVCKLIADPEVGEVAKGWAIGPFTEDEMTARFGHALWTASRRFGVVQGTPPKVRQIDDFSESFVNACVTCNEKVSVAGVDGVAYFAKFWADLVLMGRRHPRGAIEVVLDDGEKLNGVLHTDFLGEGGELVGKCLDPDSVYKQCPVAPQQAHVAVVVLKNLDTGRAEFFQCTALPFGASAAVHGFNRAAMALDYLLHESVGIRCTHYFDDYTLIVLVAVAALIEELAFEFCDLLGWRLKASKDKPMASCFVALGVEIDLTASGAARPHFSVRTRPERVEEITTAIGLHLARSAITPAEVDQLRGHLVFSNSTVFGRVGALAFYYLGRKSVEGGTIPVHVQGAGVGVALVA